MSQVSADAEARKDNIEEQYRERKADLDAQEAAVKAGAQEAKRTGTAQAATSAANIGAGILANSLGDVAKSGVEGKINNNAITEQGLQSLDKSIREYQSLEDYWNRKR